MSDAFLALSRYVRGHRLIAVTGGGGKTSLMFFLARRLCENDAEDRRVITGTTTKICKPLLSETKELLIGPYDIKRIEAALSRTHHVTVGGYVKDGKMFGFAPDVFDLLLRSNVADFIVVEADGARKLPFKVYESHEPVVPPASSLQIVVVGAEVFVQPLSKENTFRFDLLKERHGVSEGEIPVGTIIDILDDPSEYLKSSPAKAKRLLVVNKCDLLREDAVKRLSARLVASLTRYDHLTLCSLEKEICYLHGDLRRIG